MRPSKDYGKELVLDMHHCDITLFNRTDLERYFRDACLILDMERCDLHWWDDLYTPEDEKETEPHLKGTTAIQFIKTSNITLHSLDILKRVYINIFSCKDFDAFKIGAFSSEFFHGQIVGSHVIRRV